MKDLTVREAAAIIGVTPGRIRHFILEGRLSARKRGRDLFIEERVLHQFAKKERKPGRPPAKEPKQHGYKAIDVADIRAYATATVAPGN